MSNESTVQYLQQILDEVVYMEFEADQPLIIDSLVGAQLKWRVDLDLGVDLPLEDYLSGSTLREIAALLDAGAPDQVLDLEANPT